jgi:hypothetical protein
MFFIVGETYPVSCGPVNGGNDAIEENLERGMAALHRPRHGRANDDHDANMVRHRRFGD